MPPARPRRRRRLFQVFLGTVLGVGLTGQSLVERSPFLPPDFQMPGTAPTVEEGPPPSASHLQLKGVFALNGEVRVNLFNTRTNEGTWVPVNGTIEGFRVVAYDAGRRAVTLDVNGTLSHFDLAKPSDSPMAVATAPAGPGTRPAVQPGAPGTNPAATPTVRRRTIVPPRTTATPPRRITGTPGQRTIVPQAQGGQNPNSSAPGADGSGTGQPYRNPRILRTAD
jgi:hypothetical protein